MGCLMDVLVIGAGVVGLAVARALALRGHQVIVAEAADRTGSGVSSRNSGVIHGGMYYPAGSARARHCVAGRRMLYDFCATHGVEHARCGKLIVATRDEEIGAIEAIYRRGVANGVEDLQLLAGEQAVALEPALACRAAVLSGQTGIVDVHGYLLALEADLVAAGGSVALMTRIESLSRAGSGWTAAFGGATSGDVSVDAVVNAASLAAAGIARATEGYPAARVPRLVLAKGNYFSYQGRSPFSHLIYPAPVEGGLGIHVTMDLAGKLRFGPDVQWVEHEDYTVDAGRAGAFAAAIRTYWPGVDAARLTPDFAGLRPKLTGPGEAAADFVIEGPAAHGLDGLVHLFGVESPGLTSSLSLAEEVADQLAA